MSKHRSQTTRSPPSESGNIAAVFCSAGLRVLLEKPAAASATPGEVGDDDGAQCRRVDVGSLSDVDLVFSSRPTLAATVWARVREEEDEERGAMHGDTATFTGSQLCGGSDEPNGSDGGSGNDAGEGGDGDDDEDDGVCWCW